MDKSNLQLQKVVKHHYKIHDKLYDLTEFVKIHPGGEDMFNNLKSNINITPLVYSYHKNPKSILEILPKYEIPLNDTVIKFDTNYTYDKYCELKKEVYDEIHEKKLPLYWSHNEIAYNGFMLSLYLGMWIYGFSNGNDLSNWWVCLMILMTTGITNLIFHETAHYCGFKDQRINQFLTLCSYPVMLDSNWKFIHNYSHHCFTNSENDFDFNLPNQLIRHSVDQPYKFMHKFQSLYSLIIFQLAFIHKGFIVSIQKRKLNFICLLVMLYYIGFYKTIIWYSLTSLFFAFIAQVNHIQTECIQDNKDTKNDFLYNQVTSSMNYRTDDIVTRFLCFGLDIQIEHHLFPNIPHSTLRQIQHVVRNYCKKNDITYIENVNMYHSIVSYVKYLYAVGNPTSL
jgi:linoleoyl-CoA desaturase